MTRRWRHRFAVAALLALLLQQVAIAGHLCAPGMAALASDAETTAIETAMPCHAAAVPVDHESPAPHSDSGCRQHCDAGQTRVDAGFAGSVPMLPPASAWQPVLQTDYVPARALTTTSHNGDPPPRQRFCSLLI